MDSAVKIEIINYPTDVKITHLRKTGTEGMGNE